MDELSIAMDKIIWFRTTGGKLHIDTPTETFVIEDEATIKDLVRLLRDPQVYERKKWINIPIARL